MSDASDTPRIVIVISGDALADWIVAQRDESEPRRTTGPKWQSRQQGVQQHEIPGGIRLLDDLIKKVTPDDIHVSAPKWEHVDWFDKQISHYHAILAPFPKTDKVNDFDDLVNFRWRISDDLGITRREQRCNGEHNEKCYDPKDPATADLVIIGDSGLGFFEEHPLPQAINNGQNDPWLIVKSGGDGMLTRTDFLRPTLHARRDKVIFVTTADDLRRVAGLEIRRGTAWERAASDCVRIFQQERLLNQYRFVVISFGPAGAFLFDRDKRAEDNCSLFYDPVKVEGAPDFWLNGRMWGYTSTLLCAIVREVAQAPESRHVSLDDPSLRMDELVQRGVARGLKAMQEVYRNGFGPVVKKDGESLVPCEPVFPFSAIKSALEITDEEIALDENIKEVPVPARDIKSSAMFASGTNLEEIAREIVYRGAEQALADTKIPHLKYGKIVSVDRREIESFQSVRALVKEYAERAGTRVRRYWKSRAAKTPVPLSIAVFGQPGSGKSTAVREVVSSIKVQEREFIFKEFNLSQFRDTSELIDSFHLIRDERLRGRVPVVLWDEFDSFFGQPLGWLRYFLSPMQDGTFQQGDNLHPIGRSVFVFAGGISSSLDDFRSTKDDPDFDEYKASKGPDFLSRVRGTMELRGIDKHPEDPFWVIRRAILLRSILKAETSLFLDGEESKESIDRDVLNGFLRVSAFNHGVRSMRAVVVNSTLLGERYFSRSSLPNTTQLNLHVDATKFYDAMDRP
ncbi:AAA family ATPase [Streptomyces longwoodensis]